MIILNFDDGRKVWRWYKVRPLHTQIIHGYKIGFLQYRDYAGEMKWWGFDCKSGVEITGFCSVVGEYTLEQAIATTLQNLKMFRGKTEQIIRERLEKSADKKPVSSNFISLKLIGAL